MASTITGIAKDPLSVPLADYENVAVQAMDLIMKNKDTCNMMKFGDDWKNWCLEDEERCFHGKGMEDRVVDNAIEIIGTMIDLYKLLDTDDTCYTTQEQTEEVSRLMHDLGEMTSYLTGFDIKYNENAVVKHVKKSAFRDAVHEFRKVHHMGLKAVLKMDFPQGYKIVHDALHAVKSFMRMIDHELELGFEEIDQFMTMMVNALDHEIDAFVGLFAPPKLPVYRQAPQQSLDFFAFNQAPAMNMDIWRLF